MDPSERQRRARWSGAGIWRAAVLGCLFFLCAPFVPPPPAYAQQAATAGPRLTPLDPQLPWTIEADRVRYDPFRSEYIAEGNVVISKMDRSISADRVRYSRQTMIIFAEGHVTVTTGLDYCSPAHITF